MKLIKYWFICSLITVLAVSCEKGLDPIIPVSPKPDVSGPTLVINYPVEGKPFVSPEEVATITIKLVATDDVELKSVILQLDGTEIGSLTDFKDYRRADVKFDYDLGSGDHTLTVTATDLTDKSITQTVNFRKITAPVYIPLDGEVLYFPFDSYYLDLITGNAATPVGTPGFAAGKLNDAYAGAQDAYLTYPSAGIIGDNLSAAFWYKINAIPDRAGIFMISPPTTIVLQDRTKGLRFAREADGIKQKFWFNIGNGTVDSWFVPPSFDVTDDWMFIAFTVSESHVTIYINGEISVEGDYEGPINWNDCSSISLMSGAPNVIYWDHLSDLSLIDELHIFTRVISAAEVQSLYAIK
ncbi:MAG: Ig-like domain-containing protein [Bacteroidales bacterium]|nr:Ig-like domain-containing protein [Bacteroidales bacterium]